MVHYQYYTWQITPCAVLWDIPSGRIYSCVLLSCSRTLFHLMAVLRCLDVSLYIVMRFQIQGAEDLSTHSAACMVWNKLSNRHRGLGRSFLQRIRKPLTVLEQASGAHTKPFLPGQKVQSRAAFSMQMWEPSVRCELLEGRTVHTHGAVGTVSTGLREMGEHPVSHGSPRCEQSHCKHVCQVKDPSHWPLLQLA